MYFDFPAFLRYNYKSFFKAKGKNYRLTLKRFLILFIWLLLFIPIEIIYHFSSFSMRSFFRVTAKPR